MANAPEQRGPTAGARWLLLQGRDYPRLGPLGCAKLAGGGAVALSRGAYPKPYSHVDPNEDGALVYRNGAATLLCVVDGHNGARASEVALGLVLSRADALLTDDDIGFAVVVQELVETLARELQREKSSRTCLLVASLRGERGRWAGFGDCALYRAARRGPENQANNLWLGREPPAEARRPSCWSGQFTRASNERVALVTDGITNYLRDDGRIHELLGGPADDATLAMELAQGAMHRGAGDNVAVATIGP